MTKCAIINFDGASKRNPGPAGWGYVIREVDGDSILFQDNGSMGVATNNEAEYEGCIQGMQKAKDLDYTEIWVRGDSNLVCSQVTKGWKVKAKNLIPYHSRAFNLYYSFDRKRFDYVPRANNADADALASAAAVLSDV